MLDFLVRLDQSEIGEEFHHFYLECFLFYYDHHLDDSSLSFHDFMLLCFERYFSEEFAIEIRKLILHEDKSN